MMTENDRKSRSFMILIHLICWVLIMSFPFLFIFDQDDSSMDWQEYFRRSGPVISYCILFYLNYFMLIPKLLFRERQKRFLAVNALAVIVFCLGIQVWLRYVAPAPALPPMHMPRVNPTIIFFLRDAFIMILTIGLAAAIRLNSKLANAENARRDAEKSRTEAELKNLRNQLNPHFLLNTLNNIYALIAFDADKAQGVVQELSRLLRYVLYDNQNGTVPLAREMDFIRDYISLMKIRLSPKVRLTTSFDIREDSRRQIAPLIFISLIENAFKHGVSSSEESFIDISFSEQPDSITCTITNSCHPKNRSDKSGSGIGLEQVRRRLELIYPGKYEWKYGTDNGTKTYFSNLTIWTARNKPYGSTA